MRNSKNDAKALDDKLTGSLLVPRYKHTHVAVTVRLQAHSSSSSRHQATSGYSQDIATATAHANIGFPQVQCNSQLTASAGSSKHTSHVHCP